MQSTGLETETQITVEDIVDRVKIKTEIDELRKSVVSYFLQDRLVTGLREECKRLATLYVERAVEDGRRWDAALQRDLLQRVRREVQRGVLFQRLREELRRQISDKKLKEQLRQACASCLEEKEKERQEKEQVASNETLVVTEPLQDKPEEAIETEEVTETQVYEAGGGENVHSSKTEDSDDFMLIDTNKEEAPKTESVINNTSAENSCSQTEKESCPLQQDSTSIGETKSILKEEVLEFQSSENNTLNVSDQKPNTRYSLRKANPESEDIGLGRRNKSSHSTKSWKTFRKTDEHTTQETSSDMAIDQGQLAQDLGNRMIGRKIKILRFTDTGQMKWVQAEVLKYNKQSKEHQLEMANGETEWILFSRENILFLK
eukprot:jgi/Galph1/4444/GphlegSOOS_G3107.1